MKKKIVIGLLILMVAVRIGTMLNSATQSCHACKAALLSSGGRLATTNITNNYTEEVTVTSETGDEIKLWPGETKPIQTSPGGLYRVYYHRQGPGKTENISNKMNNIVLTAE